MRPIASLRSGQLLLGMRGVPTALATFVPPVSMTGGLQTTDPSVSAPAFLSSLVETEAVLLH